MGSCELRIKASATRELEGIDSNAERRRVVDRMASLEKNARPSGCLKLTDRDGYRVRQGSYRILYEVDDESCVVTMFKIGHRRDVYA